MEQLGVGAVLGTVKSVIVDRANEEKFSNDPHFDMVVTTIHAQLICACACWLHFAHAGLVRVAHKMTRPTLFLQFHHERRKLCSFFFFYIMQFGIAGATRTRWEHFWRTYLRQQLPWKWLATFACTISSSTSQQTRFVVSLVRSRDALRCALAVCCVAREYQTWTAKTISRCLRRYRRNRRRNANRQKT